ncbi:LysR family transcriptional regulator, partial [Burkholderia thailandensis]|nr:LysR family transcriptional regulator [Burkholderia thailandensis]
GIAGGASRLPAHTRLRIRVGELADQWEHRCLPHCARACDDLPKYTREFIAFLTNGWGKGETFAA